ncbi:MAG: TatD family hydrolase [Acidobacteriota bacterium]|nr:TatD family hydrolase [Acidobacteriota bacterium]
MTRFLLDSHAHLDDSDFDPDRAAVIERARTAGLRYILIAGGGTGPDHLDSPLAIAESHDWIYASVGIHPHEAQHFTDSHAEKIRQLARHPKVLAVGEIGLDYYYDHSPRDVQKQVLIRQMELARELKLPIIIHCRDAWADLCEIAAAHWKPTGLGGILHCFTGSVKDAQTFMELGFLISFAGNLTFKKTENLRDVARLIPLDRMLTETDSPYLAPVPHRGKRNEPAYVRGVTQELARLHNLTEEEIALQVLQNFEKFVAGISRP